MNCNKPINYNNYDNNCPVVCPDEYPIYDPKRGTCRGTGEKSQRVYQKLWPKACRKNMKWCSRSSYENRPRSGKSYLNDNNRLYGDGLYGDALYGDALYGDYLYGDYYYYPEYYPGYFYPRRRDRSIYFGVGGSDGTRRMRGGGGGPVPSIPSDFTPRTRPGPTSLPTSPTSSVGRGSGGLREGFEVGDFTKPECEGFEGFTNYGSNHHSVLF